MLPQVTITKTDGNTGVVRPSTTGVAAIIATAEKGTANQPSSHTRTQLAFGEFGTGPLVELGSHVMGVAGKPTLLIRPTTSTAAAYSTVTHTGAGTGVVTAGATAPLDDYKVKILFVNGGTRGVAGITYKESLDGGKTYSAEKALGVAVQIDIPLSGVSLALGVGTYLAGQTEEVTTTAARMTNGDLVTALEALRVTKSPWETVLVFGDADATMVGTLETWLLAREAEGKYRTAVVCVRGKNAAESEAAYKTAVQTLMASMSSTRVVVCADRGDVASAITGIVLGRPTSLFVTARGMKIDIGRDAAYVADGPLPGVTISDDRGNPKHHDEALYPGLDDLRATTLRTFDGFEGVYVTNPNLVSPSGSDYVYWQHARVMNRACEIAFQILGKQLSLGVQKDPKPGPNGERYILEEDAQFIEGLVNAQLQQELVTPKRCVDAKFTLNRTDDLSSNGPGTLSGPMEIVSKAYVKKFNVESRYVKTITASAQ